MKIAILANSSGGLYNFRRDLILQMKADGHEILAVTPMENRVEELNTLGIRLVKADMDRRGVNPFKDLSLMKWYKKILKKENPDLVITYTVKPNIYGGLACRKLKIPYAGNVTGLGTAFEKNGLLKTIVTLLNKAGLKEAHRVFFENNENKTIFVNLKIVSNEQAVVLNGAGVNLDYFYLAQYPPEGEILRFLFMGRIMKEKGIEELFEAMHLLYLEGYHCCLDVLGNYEESYEPIVKKYEADGWLRYYGYQKDVRPFIEQAHCFVLPSWHEGMANTILESAAMGRPVITSNIPGCMEAVIDGKSGYLCQVKSTNDLYEKLKKFISLSNEQKQLMGLAGHNHVKVNFDKKTIVNKTLANVYSISDL